MSAVPDPKSRSGPVTSIYNRRFWIAYCANVLLVASNAVTFKFADLVDLLGGSKEDTGEIIRFGLYGAVGVRLVLGQWMDRYGIGRCWRVGSLLALLGAVGMATVSSLGWQLDWSRFVYAAGLGVLFSCSMAHIQNEVPPRFRTEVIASLGSSGFLGLMLGTIAADVIAGMTELSLTRYAILFGVTAGCQAAYLLMVTVLTWNDPRPRNDFPTPPAWVLLRRYWPGSVVLCGLFMGAGFAATSVYLTQLAELRGFSGISWFFVPYAMSAFVFRVLSRTWSYHIGRYRLTVIGLVAQAVGFVTIPVVMVEWALAFPAVVIGFGHALLFPAVVSLGTRRYPKRYRGTGTTLILAFFDAGGLLLAPAMGWIIDRYGYSPMYVATAGFAVAAAAVFGGLTMGVLDSDQRPRPAAGAQSKAGLLSGEAVPA